MEKLAATIAGLLLIGLVSACSAAQAPQPTQTIPTKYPGTTHAGTTAAPTTRCRALPAPEAISAWQWAAPKM